MKRKTHSLLIVFLLCIAQLVVAQTEDYRIEKLESNINTNRYDEISPVISLDGKTLYFTRVGSDDFNQTLWQDGEDISERMRYRDIIYNMRLIYSEIAGYAINDPVHSDFNQDIWVAESLEKTFDRIVHPGKPLNTALPNSICSLTPDANAFVVINQFSREGGMNRGFSIVRHNPDNSWSDPIPMQIDNYDVISSAISLTMSTDGRVLIMSLPHGDSYGDNDLYISFQVGDNHWSAPKNMGKVINTAYREVTPHLSADGKDLYFASNRPNGIGGLDLYWSSRSDDTWLNWSKPRIFVYPINTAGDESQPYFNPVTGYLYFSSRRAGTSDIYRTKIAPEISGDVTVSGKVVNAQTGKPIDTRVMYGDSSSVYYDNYIDTRDGQFNVKIVRGKSVKMAAQRPGYISREIKLQYQNNQSYSKPPEIVLELDSIAVGVNLVLNPIFFEQSKPVIVAESYLELDRLADVLKQFPEICVSIEGHTDNQGKPNELQKLSEDRAAEVKKFLVRNKINPKRIETVGFGATKPINANITTQEREQNRRVEVRVAKINYGL